MSDQPNMPTSMNFNLERFSLDADDNKRLLERCRNAWDNLSDFRSRRARARKYLSGDQWHELVANPNGTGFIREDKFIQQQGRIPFKQNVLAQLVRNILGQFLDNPSNTSVVSRNPDKRKVGDMLTRAIQAVNQLNYTEIIDESNLLEFIMSGMAITKTSYDYFKAYNRSDVNEEIINPARFFFNANLTDPRIERTLTIVGEIRDVPVDAVIAAYAKNEQDAQMIRDIYARNDEDNSYMASSRLDTTDIDSLDFNICNDLTLCRVIEVWRLKSQWRVHWHDKANHTYGTDDISPLELEKINDERIRMFNSFDHPNGEQPALIEYTQKYEQFWVVKHLSPDGHCFFSSETPYDHEEHPYNIVVTAVDGYVKGLVEELIDQQRFINRLINLMDISIGMGAKNTLMIPSDSIPDSMSFEDMVREFAKVNGAIEFNSNPNNPNLKPFILSAQSSDVGASNLLQVQMNLISQISGVNSAMQGHTASPGTPAALYAQEAQNSSLNIRSIMVKFNHLREKRDRKALQVLRQYYNEPRYLAVTGSMHNKDIIRYDPNAAFGVEIELIVSQGVDTPAYRQAFDQLLMQLLTLRLIDVETYLSNSSMPNAEKLLEEVKLKRQELQAEQAQQAQAMQQAQAQQSQAPQQA